MKRRETHAYLVRAVVGCVWESYGKATVREWCEEGRLWHFRVRAGFYSGVGAGRGWQGEGERLALRWHRTHDKTALDGGPQAAGWKRR